MGWYIAHIAIIHIWRDIKVAKKKPSFLGEG